MAINISRLVFFSVLLIATNAYGELLMRGNSEGMSYRIEVVARGLGVPWGMVFLNNENILITERNGRLSLLDRFSGRVQRVEGVPSVYASGQGGFLDVAIPFGQNSQGWIYFTYSKPYGKTGVTTLARAKYSHNRLVEWQDLLITKSESGTTRHFGSRIAFDHQGHVFFSVGDRGDRPNGQNMMTHAGSVLRLNLDGSVPADNPFVSNKDALPELWSVGHRNPQGLAYDMTHKRLWLIEHGPRGGDELNLIQAGKNYGWPVISYGKEYWGPLDVGEAKAKEGMEQPVKYYVPSIAPGSLLLYSGEAFPKWKGDLFAGALKLMHLNRIVLSDSAHAVGEERLLGKLKERIRALVQSPEGWLYLSTDSGRIMVLSPDA